MQQWEYTSLRLNELPRRANEIDLLNDVGKEGWELVNVTVNNIAYLKRQVAAPAAPTSTRRRSTTDRNQTV